MRRIFAAVMIIAMAAACVFLTSCNDGTARWSNIDMNYTFAFVGLPDGNRVEGPVDAWHWGSDGTLQVQIRGITYLTHASNVVLCTEKPA
jgi:hypothetical protein